MRAPKKPARLFMYVPYDIIVSIASNCFCAFMANGVDIKTKYHPITVKMYPDGVISISITPF